MATYRCRSCDALYVDPMPVGTRYFHACGERVVDYDKGTRAPYPNPRDENITQDEKTGKVAIKAVGAGREMVDKRDILTGATFDEVQEIRARIRVQPEPLSEEVFPEPKAWIGGAANR